MYMKWCSWVITLCLFLYILHIICVHGPLQAVAASSQRLLCSSFFFLEQSIHFYKDQLILKVTRSNAFCASSLFLLTDSFSSHFTETHKKVTYRASITRTRLFSWMWSSIQMAVWRRFLISFCLFFCVCIYLASISLWTQLGETDVRCGQGGGAQRTGLVGGSLSCTHLTEVVKRGTSSRQSFSRFPLLKQWLSLFVTCFFFFFLVGLWWREWERRKLHCAQRRVKVS